MVVGNGILPRSESDFFLDISSVSAFFLEVGVVFPVARSVSAFFLEVGVVFPVCLHSRHASMNVTSTELQYCSLKNIFGDIDGRDWCFDGIAVVDIDCNLFARILLPIAISLATGQIVCPLA